MIHDGKGTILEFGAPAGGRRRRRRHAPCRWLVGGQWRVWSDQNQCGCGCGCSPSWKQTNISRRVKEKSNRRERNQNDSRVYVCVYVCVCWLVGWCRKRKGSIRPLVVGERTVGAARPSSRRIRSQQFLYGTQLGRVSLTTTKDGRYSQGSNQASKQSNEETI